MSISALGSPAASTPAVDPSDVSASTRRKGKTGEASPVPNTGSPQASIVTLSSEAQGFADLASKGVMSFTISDGKRMTQDLMNGVSTGARASGGFGGTVSAADFDDLMVQFGATQSQAERIRQGFDSDGDGSITNDEMLGGFAGTMKSSPDAQMLLGLMDKNGNGDGVVQQREFSDIQTALVYAQKKAN